MAATHHMIETHEMVPGRDCKLMAAFPGVKGRCKDGLPLSILLVDVESVVLLTDVEELRVEIEKLTGHILFAQAPGPGMFQSMANLMASIWARRQ